MKIISFAYTTAPLLHRAKTCTRRAWNERYARTFRAGEIVQAWDKSPRFGGRRVADIRLTQDPYLEPLSAMPNEDYEREGFAWLHEHQDQISPSGREHFGTFSREEFEAWRQNGGEMWVVRFELLRLAEGR